MPASGLIDGEMIYRGREKGKGRKSVFLAKKD